MSGTIAKILSRILAVALLCTLVLVAAKGIVEPVVSEHRDIEDQIVAQRTLLGRLLEAASPDKAMQQPQTGDLEPVFVDGETDAIRIANLQERLSTAAQSIGARLSSTQAVEPRQTQDVRLIGVQTQFSTTLVQLQKLLFDLETAKPSLFVDTLHISRGPDRDNQEVNDLDVRLVVLGATPPVKGQP